MSPEDLCVLVRAVTGRAARILRVGALGTVVVRIEGGVRQLHRLRVLSVLNPEDNVIVLGEFEDR